MARSRPGPGLLVKYHFEAVLVVLLATVLAGGCASVHTNGGNNLDMGPEIDGQARKITVLASAESDIEPTVIEPTVVAYRDYHDPLIRINRTIFAFNDVTYRYALIPLSKGYLRIVPTPVHESIGNFFANIKTPIYLANYLLQLQGRPLLKSLQRFGINTTVGLLGLFDPALDWYGIEKAEADFEDSLIHYGADYGAYLVLPILGPSDIRNGISLVVDQFLNPIPYLLESPGSIAVQGLDNFQQFAPEAEQYEIIQRESEDPYLFLRNLYLQGIQRDVDY